MEKGRSGQTWLSVWSDFPCGSCAKTAAVISAAVSAPIGATGKTIGADIQKQIDAALEKIEEINEKKFGDAKNPLLVSVRSGARASMPGMMDTILNLGINDEVAAGLIAGNPDPKFERFVYDSYPPAQGWPEDRTQSLRFRQDLGNHRFVS